jgi:hypothetical protein
MRLAIIAILLGACPAGAENTLTEQQRAQLAQQQRQLEQRKARAQARCIEQRGADCVTDQGLQEWMLLDRSREEAVLDTLRDSGAGATSPYGQGEPSPSGATGRPLPGQQR